MPVLAGAVGGTLRTPDGAISLDGGTGYHDHNWGFWAGVTWHWGQVAHEGLSFVWGRILPPADAADPQRVPGFLGVLGTGGPIGFSTRVTIVEDHGSESKGPRTITVRAESESVDLEMRLDVVSVERTGLAGPMARGAENLDFLQMRTIYRVTGRIGSRPVDFTAPGAAETFVDRSSRAID